MQYIIFGLSCSAVAFLPRSFLTDQVSFASNPLEVNLTMCLVYAPYLDLRPKLLAPVWCSMSDVPLYHEPEKQTVIWSTLWVFTRRWYHSPAVAFG